MESTNEVIVVDNILHWFTQGTPGTTTHRSTTKALGEWFQAKQKTAKHYRAKQAADHFGGTVAIRTKRSCIVPAMVYQRQF